MEGARALRPSQRLRGRAAANVIKARRDARSVKLPQAPAGATRMERHNAPGRTQVEWFDAKGNRLQRFVQVSRGTVTDDKDDRVTRKTTTRYIAGVPATRSSEKTVNRLQKLDKELGARGGSIERTVRDEQFDAQHRVTKRTDRTTTRQTNTRQPVLTIYTSDTTRTWGDGSAPVRSDTPSKDTRKDQYFDVVRGKHPKIIIASRSAEGSNGQLTWGRADRVVQEHVGDGKPAIITATRSREAWRSENTNWTNWGGLNHLSWDTVASSRISEDTPSSADIQKWTAIAQDHGGPVSADGYTTALGVEATAGSKIAGASAGRIVPGLSNALSLWSVSNDARAVVEGREVDPADFAGDTLLAVPTPWTVGAGLFFKIALTSGEAY